MSTPSRHQGTLVVDTRQEAGAHPSAPPGKSGSGHGIVSLRLAAAAFVTAPFLLLLPEVDFIPVVLVVAGVVFTCVGLKQSGRRPGLSVAGLIVPFLLLGLTLSIAIPWIRPAVVPAISGYTELQEIICQVKLALPDIGGLSLSSLLGLFTGALLVVGGLLLRCRQS